MAETKLPEQAQIFIIKMWREVLNHDQSEWRGRIQDVRSGEIHYFRDWQTIIGFITTLLPELKNGKRPRSKKELTMVSVDRQDPPTRVATRPAPKRKPAPIASARKSKKNGSTAVDARG